MLLPGLVTCQGDPIKVLDKMTDVPGLYFQKLQNENGCDSILYQNLSVLPRPLLEENFGFCAGDTLFILDTMLTQSGQICRSYPAANGCDSLYCAKATTYALPLVTDPDTLVGISGQPVVLTGPGGYVQYVWIPADPNCPNCPVITVPSDSGYVEYQLFVTDGNGCEGTITYRIIFFPPCDAQRLRIPNAFTPNDDGVNDVFRVVPYEGAEIIGSLTIYDRWGEKVYENQGNVFWDGTIDGKPGPSDVYVYRIDIICDGEPEAVWGDVTLLR
jgi:gliding motility-associated-like protein